MPGSFSEFFKSTRISALRINPEKRKNKNIIVLHSDKFLNQPLVLCGLENDQLGVVDISQDLENEFIGLPIQTSAKIHSGLSSVKCSKNSQSIFYSSSSSDGKIFLWDERVKSNKASQSFSPETSGVSSKGILSFDLSRGDQLLCAGTELVDEDSFLLFWDLRSSKLLGAYWESHSDDITCVGFHPSKSSSVLSGSTDGLLNAYNLQEPSEDEALLFSFNTESSVEKLFWELGETNSARVGCITHTNEIKIWDYESGDISSEFSRADIRETMKTSDDDVYISGCFTSPNSPSGVLVSSISGSESLRYLELPFENEEKGLKPRAIFEEKTLIQTAQYYHMDNCWVTFDANGGIRFWTL